MSFARLKSLFHLKDPGPALWLMLGHGATHWVLVTFYLMLPVLTKVFDLSYAEAGGLVAAYQFGGVSLSLVSGPLVDLTGRRVPFQVVALVVLAAGIASFGLADEFIVLVMLSWVIGGAAHFWHAPATAFISTHYKENRGYVIGIHGVGSNMGEAYGSIAAGVLIASLGWQHASMVISIPTFCCAIAIWIALMPRDRVHKAARQKEMTFREYLRGMASVLTNPTVIMLYLMVGTRAAAQQLIKTFLPLYMAHILAMNAVWQGLALSAMHHGGMVANPIAGVLSDRHGRRRILVIAFIATAVIMLGLTIISNPVVFVFGVAVLGFTHYALRPVVQSWMLDALPEELHGSSVSLRSATQGLFGVVVPPLGGWVGDVYGLTTVFYLIAVLLLSANVFVWFIPRRQVGEATKPAE